MNDTKYTRPILDLVDPSFYEPLGEVTAYFALLDFSLGRAVARLLFPGEDNPKVALGDIVGSQLSFRKKIDIFAALYRFQLPEGALSELGAVCGSLQSIEDRRNQVTHSIWGSDPASRGSVRRLKIMARREGARFHAEPFSRDTLLQLRDDISTIMPRLEALYLAASDLLSAPPTPPGA